MVIEMKKIKKILKQILLSSQYYSVNEEFQEMSNEDKELYRFMRGGFAAK
jgi:hypothetical protein